MTEQTPTQCDACREVGPTAGCNLCPSGVRPSRWQTPTPDPWKDVAENIVTLDTTTGARLLAAINAGRDVDRALDRQQIAEKDATIRQQSVVITAMEHTKEVLTTLAHQRFQRIADLSAQNEWLREQNHKLSVLHAERVVERDAARAALSAAEATIQQQADQLKAEDATWQEVYRMQGQELQRHIDALAAAEAAIASLTQRIDDYEDHTHE